MSSRRKYHKKADQFVVAVQLDLDTDGFIYTKWGDTQRCKRRDWLVDNNGDVYSVDQEVFANTYRPVRRGAFVKTSPVWAEVATTSGHTVTKEGKSHYNPGDYLVYNNEDGTDAYCMSKERFEAMYELAE